MLALYVVLSVLAGVVLFAVLILSVPVEMAFDTSRPGEKAKVGWAFGLLWKDVGGRKKPRKPKGKKRKGPGLRTFLSLLTARGVSRGILGLVGRLVRGIRVRQLDARLRIGLGDPADTGMLCAVLWPVLVPLGYAAQSNVRLDICFDEETVEFAGRGHVRIVPAQMIWAVLMFALSPAGLRMAGGMLVRQWRSKRQKPGRA